MIPLWQQILMLIGLLTLGIASIVGVGLAARKWEPHPPQNVKNITQHPRYRKSYR
jgi:hypothetical protein